MNKTNTPEKVSEDKWMLCYISFSKIKPYIKALQAMPRWDVYLDKSKIDLYKKDYVKRDLDEFIIKLQENKLIQEDIKKLVDDVLSQVSKADRDQHKTKKWYLDGLLPEDGDSRNHTKTQTNIAKKYGNLLLNEWSITKNQNKILEILSMVHDIAESIVGDRVIKMKKDDFTKFEFEVWKYIINQISVSPEVAKELNNIYQICFIKEAGLVDQESVSASDKDLAEHFALLEKIWYLISWHRAQKFESDIKDDSHDSYLSKYNSSYIIYSVLINQIKSLDADNNPKHTPIIESFCKEYQNEIIEMFNYIHSSWFLLSSWLKENIPSSEKLEKINNSRIWRYKLQKKFWIKKNPDNTPDIN